MTGCPFEGVCELEQSLSVERTTEQLNADWKLRRSEPRRNDDGGKPCMRGEIAVQIRERPVVGDRDRWHTRGK